MNRRKLLGQSGAVGAPLVVYLAARTLLVPAPVAVDAGLSHVVAEMPPAVSGSSTPAQQAAQEWCLKAERELRLQSPFGHELVVAAPVPMVESDPPPPEELTPIDVPSPVEGLRLSAVLGDESEGMAMINGKVYRVGGMVGELKVVRIDVRHSRVSLQARDGKVYTIGRREE
jgi:hypothetical protein